MENKPADRAEKKNHWNADNAAGLSRKRILQPDIGRSAQKGGEI